MEVKTVVMSTELRVRVKAWLAGRGILRGFDGLVYLNWLYRHGKIGGPQDHKDDQS